MSRLQEFREVIVLLLHVVCSMVNYRNFIWVCLKMLNLPNKKRGSSLSSFYTLQKAGLLKQRQERNLSSDTAASFFFLGGEPAKQVDTKRGACEQDHQLKRNSGRFLKVDTPFLVGF